VDYQAYGVILAESGDTEQYELFCDLAVTNFATETSGDILKNGGILKTCLLFPVDKKRLEALKPMANDESRNWNFKNNPKVTDWACIPPALWKYRCGDYTEAADWCEFGLSGKLNKFSASNATLHIMLAMVDYQRGQASAACSELAQGTEVVKVKFNSELERGKSGGGYWYDWVFAKHLLQEATELIDCNSTNTSPEATDGAVQ
jgi:hypothetical protein